MITPAVIPSGCLFFRRVALCMMWLSFSTCCGGVESGSTPSRTSLHSTNRLVVAFWNVENLFDTKDDPYNEGDDAFTPNGWRHWTERRYRKKLSNLVRVIEEMDPDIIGFAEVENRAVLDDLNLMLGKAVGKRYPFVAHREGPDHRGIDVALLARVEPVRVSWTAPVEQQREILSADFSVGGAPFSVFVCHWKSRWGPRKQSDAVRWRQARAVRAEMDRRLRVDPDAAIVVVGDFNDDFDGRSMRELLRSIADFDRVCAERSAGWLFNLHGGLLAEERGTTFYKKKAIWNSFDMISVTRAMVVDEEPSGWKVQRDSYKVFAPAFIRDGDGRPKAFRLVTNKETGRREYLYGYSDHFPVLVTMERK